MLSTALRRWVQGSRSFRALTSSSVTSRSRSVYVEYAKPQAQEALKPRILITGRRHRRLTVQLWNVWNYEAAGDVVDENFLRFCCAFLTHDLSSPSPSGNPPPPVKSVSEVESKAELKKTQAFRPSSIPKILQGWNSTKFGLDFRPQLHLSRPVSKDLQIWNTRLQLRWLACVIPMSNVVRFTQLWELDSLFRISHGKLVLEAQ